MDVPIDEISSLPQYQQDIILDGPALKSPNGTTSNFVDPSNQDGLSYFLITLFLVISTTAILIRAYSSLLCVKKIFLEDCTSALVTTVLILV